MSTIDSTSPATDTDTDPVAVQVWTEPEGIAPRGTLIVLGGRGETPAVYERFGSRIARDAYRVHALGDVTVDTEATRAAALALLADESLPAPKVLVGSDAGAALALELATGNDADAVVLAGLPTPEGERGEVTGDQVEARTACPNHQKVLRREVRENALDLLIPLDLLGVTASAVRVPLLAIHGAEDTVSPLPAALEVYRESPRPEIAVVAGGRHDALNDVTHRSVAATVVLFLERIRAARLDGTDPSELIVRSVPAGSEVRTGGAHR